MMFHASHSNTHPGRLFAPVAFALLAVVGGCTSLDPKPDINRAASTVAERTGVTPTWTEPWEASLTSWDGHSPLKVEQALAMALRNNREIRSQVEQIAVSRADLVQAGLLPNPVLGLTLRFPFDPVSGGTFIGAQVMQSFTALWLRNGKISAADARLNQTVLDISDKALRLVAELKTTHARIAFGQRAVHHADHNLATIQRSIDSLEARVRGGEGTSLDVNRAHQQFAKAQAERASVVRDLAKDKRLMLELIGFASESAEWTVEENASVVEAISLDEAAAITLAGSQRLDVAAARAIVEAQKADLSVEERSRLKDFGLGADFERDADGKKSIGPVVEVGIPIFDTNAAQIAKVGSLARATLANYEAVAQRAIREARVAWVEYDSASQLANQYRSTVLPLSERNLSLAEASLKAGQTDVTVLLEAQREVIDARTRLNDLERQAAIARLELEYAVGGRLVTPPPLTSAHCQPVRDGPRFPGSVAARAVRYVTDFSEDRMASYYDEKKKCRVGEMDEAQFNRECEPDNAAYFKGLIAAWTKAGGTLKWGAGGVGLRGPIDGKVTGVCFLAPQFAGKKDRIELACAALGKQIGERRVKSLDAAIRDAANEHTLGKTMISVVQPGTLPAVRQRSLTKAFVELL